MLKSENRLWGRRVVPNLPHHLLQEYMFMLGEYAECRATLAVPVLRAENVPLWCFPFFELDATFDQENYDKWVSMVEQDMMERHNLTEEAFM
jgi:hypothetical protein